MAKKVKAIVTLAISAGKANPAPPIGPALAQHGINLMAFCKEYNARTSARMGEIIPAEITVNRGESVTVTNDDEFIHQIYNPDLFDTEERRPGQTLREAFPRAGTFEVRCHIHPKMKLVVHVN